MIANLIDPYRTLGDLRSKLIAGICLMLVFGSAIVPISFFTERMGTPMLLLFGMPFSLIAYPLQRN